MSPVLLTRRGLAAEAADAWVGQYLARNGRWLGDFHSAIHAALVALGPSPDPDAVDRAIGNGSWTSLRCNGCGRYVDAAIRVGEEPDYESSTATLCVPCVTEAAALAATVTP